MPFRVTPKEASVVHGEEEMPSLISLQPEMNEVSMVNDSNPVKEDFNEQLLKEIDEIYSPVLKLMKLFGTYFGHTSLIKMVHATGCCPKRLYLQRFYCGVVVSGFWLNFVVAMANIIFGAHIFVFLMIITWCLLVALSGTICLIVLCPPLADTTKSRFEYFIRGLLAVNSDVNLTRAKNKSRKGLIAFCFSFTVSAAGCVSAHVLLGMSITSIFPFNQWSGSWIILLVFLVLGCGVWFLPLLFFFVTCIILEELFCELHQRMLSLRSVSIDLASLKKEYHKLCEVVELADKVLAPLLLGMISVYLPLICFNFYQVVNLPQEHVLMYLASSIMWLLTGASIFAIIMLFGSNVSEKINGLQKTLQTFPISKEEEGKLVIFLLDLQGDPKGLSIGGLAVITKSMSLTIVGVIVSYFAVMLSLPK